MSLSSILTNIPDTILPAAKRQAVIEALQNNIPDYSIRLNPYKLNSSLPLQKVNWCKNAYYLESKPAFSMDPLWHAGAYYVQEAGSMFLDSILRALPIHEKPIVALDLCASPGGKTTLMAGTLPNGSTIVANEVTDARRGALIENVIKYGSANVLISKNKSTDFKNISNFFDLILVDAPCSGEGLLRRNPEALAQWSPQLLTQCALTQKSILADAWESLKPGAFLIYSTCALNACENENNLEWMINNLGAENPDVSFQTSTNIIVTETKGIKAWRFFQGLTRSEGFFITVVQKSGANNSTAKIVKKSNLQRKNPLSQFFEAPQKMVFKKGIAEIRMLHENTINILEHLQKHLKFVYTGFPVARITGTKVLPDSFLPFANNITFAPETLVAVNYNESLNVLAHGNISPMSETGYAITTFSTVPFALINRITGRVNNYFPKNWRLMKRDDTKKFCIVNPLSPAN